MGWGGGWTRWCHQSCTAGTFPAGVSQGPGSGRYLRSKHQMSTHINLYLQCTQARALSQAWPTSEAG